MLDRDRAADDDRAARAVLEHEWSAYERRHGTEHLGRTADRVERQAAEHADRAPRFTTPTVGERGRAERRHAPIRAAGPSEWEDNDPDLMEPPAMADGPFRSRRRY